MTKTESGGSRVLTNRCLVAGISLLSAVMLGLVGCDKNAANEIRVGTINPTTGMYASFGEGGLYGVKAAVDDINRAGGVKVGDKHMLIKLFPVNDESDPNKAGSMAESLILQNGVKFIVAGDAPPPMHSGISQMADRHKVPYIASIGPLEPWLGMRNESPTKWKYSWGLGGFSINTPIKAGDYRAGKPGYTIFSTWTGMLEQFGPKTNNRIGIICSDDPDGRGWYTVFGPGLTKLGYTVVGMDRKLGLVPLETTDFSSIIKEWKDAGVEILWGNCPGSFFGAVWKQARGMGFKPKMVSLGRGAMFYQDVNAWGGDLPKGVGTELWWEPSMGGAVGFPGTTGMTLAERWVKDTGRPAYPAISPGYASVQVLVNAIERAGSLDADKVNAALATTDMPSMRNRVKFDENHFSPVPIVMGQWFKSSKPNLNWEVKVVYSNHDFWPTTGKPVFPLE